MACSSLSDFEALLCAEENSAALGALNKEELNQLVARVDEICAAIADPTEADTFLKEKALKKLSEYTGDTYRKPAEFRAADSPAEPEKKKGATMKAAAGSDEYIYFDLAAGDVNIGEDGKYTGWVYVKDMEGSQKVTGDHKTENKYYVYQSTNANRDETGYATKTDYEDKNNCRIPQYDRVKTTVDGVEKSWTEYITNNTNVKRVSDAWKAATQNSERTGTPNNITFASESNYTADVTIDNIWSTHHEPGKDNKYDYRTTGGIGANLSNEKINCKNTHIVLRLKGDNRVGCVHYSARQGANNTIEFNNGETGGTSGSITVADFPDKPNANYWSSAIGGADGPSGTADPADGIVINGGVIYAGTTSADDSTAIGGGGNNFGGVTITGGIVTAVASSTGTAIGGGIGWSGQGGDAEVTISGGEVYAYNHGIGPDSGSYVSFVPAAAIGGGSASTNNGNANTTVNIIDGFVYAQSVSGAAIGGGGSGTLKGGDATVNITGGTVIAKSVGGEVKYNKNNNTNHTETVLPGASIGGGTGATGGGSVTLNIREEDGKETILRTGSIGGGKTTGTGSIGSARVTIEGGDVTGQVIMAGTGDPQKKCSFTMSDGWIHDTNVAEGNVIDEVGITDPQPKVPIQYLEEDGGAVWMDDPIGVTTITGGIIERCKAKNGGAIYMNGGTADISGGTISNNTATGNGGGVYLPGGDFTLNGGTIAGNKAEQRGGGIFLTKSPTLTKGTISGNHARNSGGGLCINGDKLELTSAEMQIYDNTATENGGGVAVLNGDFILNGGAVGVEGKDPNTAEKGGGVYVEAEASAGSGTNTGDGTNLGETTASANVTVNHGNVWYNEATEGGGIYLAKGEGDFKLDGETASISHNTAKLGGGVYLYKNPLLNKGTIEANTATQDGGGMYISDCLVELEPTGGVSITGNSAKNGAGIYISGISSGSGSTEKPVNAVDATTSASPEHKVGLHVMPGFGGSLKFTDNVATDNGGAVCVNAGRFVMESERITVTGNGATNGGGVAVLNGNFTMTKGSIGAEGGANTATNGGGVYVSKGQVWLKGGSVEHNKADNGGGAYVDGGKFYMLNGSLANNEADKNGGGAYVAGEFNMLDGTIGGENRANSATNGGGAYVANGNITIVDGEISHNSASENGGGFFVSATEGDVIAKMLSGKLSYNTATKNGGGMAVESHDEKKINVEIGCLLNHAVEDGKPTLPIEYIGAYNTYANYYEVANKHGACPEVENNQAGEIGGGFYMNSDASTLSFYCVEETANTAKGSNTAGMDVLGGKVIIGDEYYHNHIHDDTLGADKHVVPWGYVSMDDATLVNGGQVDIYGDMTNPIFKNEVTVDIQDTTSDHFLDHRRAHDNEKRYKVHYIENFKGTGLYQEYQYDESNCTITIPGALYNRPGYKILGWYTQAEYNQANPASGHKFYEVGKQFNLSDKNQVPQMGMHSIDCKICGENTQDKNLLKLYAIWEVNGYTVKFDPNVPTGDTYTGTMEDEIFEYDVAKALPNNQYQYPGHIFTGWSTKADGTGTAYGDGEEVSKLTDKNGAVVVLYAQWELCDHKKSEQWTYDVVDGKTLRRICSCGGQTLTATLSADDTVYDGLSHPATLTLDDKNAWGEDAPTITYTGERLTDADKEKYKNKPLEFDTEGKPFHASKCTASITKKNGETPVTASVTYTISKADQEAPVKPTYEVSEVKTKIVIKKLTDGKDPKSWTDAAGNQHTAKAEYCLTYDNSHHTDWKKMPDGKDTLEETMTTALTNYIVQVRYEELEDYNASKITKADAVYFFEGNVTVKVNCSEGIDYKIVFAKGITTTENGVTLNLTTQEGYYLVGGDYAVKATLQKQGASSSSNHGVTEKTTGTSTEKEYSIDNIPDESTLTITIGTAKKKPMIEGQVAPGQKFSTITNTETIITRDSAFTAAFQITSFDPSTYKDLSLNFTADIPKDTTIILLDRGKDGKKAYWYYRATNLVKSVQLTDFKKMGGNDTAKYEIPTTTGDEYSILNYQFIVDFSQSASGYSGDTLSMMLKIEGNADKNAPEANSKVDVSLKTPSFSLSNPEGSGLTKGFTCEFNTNSGVASKWENRASAMILTPKGGTILPVDARIKAEVGGRTAYLYKSDSSFIIPMSLLEAGKEKVRLTLQSDLFPAEGATYDFTAKWLISPSKAGKAPINGDTKGDPKDVTFTFTKEHLPSLKSEGNSRLLTNKQELKLNINTENMSGYTISAELLRKAESGTYNGTAWNESDVQEGTLEVSLAGQTPGSFCLMLTVKKTGDITTVMEVPYYFIIKDNTGS